MSRKKSKGLNLEQKEQYISIILENLKELEENGDESFKDCCNSDISISFTLSLSTGEFLVGKDLEDNLTPISKAEGLIRKLFDQYPNVTEVGYNSFCSSCLEYL